MQIYPWIYQTSSGIPRDLGSFLSLKSQGFEENIDFYQAKFGTNGHAGIDHPCPIGTKVFSPFLSCKVKSISLDEKRGKGVVLETSEGEFLLWHFSEVLVYIGQQIYGRMVVGLSGNSGISSAPHTHAEWKPTDGQGNWLYPNNGFYGAVDFSPMMVWSPKPTEAQPMTQQEVRKLQALEGYKDDSGVVYWTGKPLSDYLNARLVDKIKTIEEAQK